MRQTEPTERPWRVDVSAFRDPAVVGPTPDHKTVAAFTACYEEGAIPIGLEDAVLIVKAVNAWDDVDALHRRIAEIEDSPL